MNFAVLSDIHSNFYALSKAEDILDSENIKTVFILGDIVGYGNSPNKCCNWLKKQNYHIIAGNHDKAVAFDDFDLTDYSETAIQGVLSNRKQITLENKRWLASLPLYYSTSNFEFVHGSLVNPESFRYIDFKQNDDLYSSVEQNFKIMKGEICFVGHTHSPAIYFKNKKITPSLIEYSLNQEAIIDVGSVGLPRNSRQNASFVIYYPEEKKVIFKRFSLKEKR